MKSIKDFKNFKLELNHQKHINGGASYCSYYSDVDEDIWEELTVDDDGNCVSCIWHGSGGSVDVGC